MSKTPGQLLYEANADPAMQSWRFIGAVQQEIWERKAQTLVREDWREAGDLLASAEITARDYFAAKAMPVAWCDIREDADRDFALKVMAANAYEMADAMLRARLTRP
jgi:hypothetical protein